MDALRTMAAFDALVERVRWRSLCLDRIGVVQAAAARCATAARIPTIVRLESGAHDLRARACRRRAAVARRRPPPPARASRPRPHRLAPGATAAPITIGPVLGEITGHLARAIRFRNRRVNFRARRWSESLQSRASTERVPIERDAAAGALAAAHQIFQDRHHARRSLWESAAIRAHAVIRGCDCWPLVQQQLAGIALLQFPWSARAMDEAAAALAALEPEVAVTYAEAGGWGRALSLECRRRGVPLAGLQHGFIYRHWLNHRHGPTRPSGSRQPGRSRFPLPRSPCSMVTARISPRPAALPARASLSPAARGWTICAHRCAGWTPGRSSA